MTIFITIHSNRGGTGKTVIALNLAAAYASMGTNACLLDLDLRAPSISTIFSLGQQKYWLNDFLNGRCKMEEILVDLSSRYNVKGKLLIGPANPSLDAIRDVIEKDKKWEMNALRRLLHAKAEWTQNGVETVILDASPGVQYSSVNAVVSSDVVLVVTTMDTLDLAGTRRIADELYRAFERNVFAIVNKAVPQFEFPPGQDERDALVDKLAKMLNLPVMAIIPCYCDILRSHRVMIHTLEKKEHPFAHAIFNIARTLKQGFA